MGATWRDDPFKPGATYRVRKSFKAFRDDFTEGELLKYDRSDYSRYDNMSGFFFTDTQGKNRAWDIHDDEPLEKWSELFEEAS